MLQEATQPLAAADLSLCDPISAVNDLVADRQGKRIEHRVLSTEAAALVQYPKSLSRTESETPTEAYLEAAQIYVDRRGDPCPW